MIFSEQARRRTSKAGLIVGLVCVAILALGLAFLAIVATRPFKPIVGEIVPIENNRPKAVNFAWPNDGQAAIGRLDSGLKATFGDSEKHPTASLAKVITALVVLDRKPFAGDGPLVTMTQSDVDAYHWVVSQNGTNLYVEAGEQLTERQMLEAVMLISANNIADSLARWAFGSHAEYKKYAESWLGEHGLTDTIIGADASGFDPGTVSTASDLFEISRLALAEPVLAEIMRKSTTVLPIIGEVKNTNRMLVENPGTIGLKTGNSDQAGSCLMFAVERQIDGEKITLAGVLLGQEYGTTFDLAKALADSAVQSSSTQKLPSQAVVGHYYLPWGKIVEAKTVSDLLDVSWTDEDIQLQATLDNLTLPTRGRQTVGQVEADSGISDVVVNDIIVEPNFWWRLKNLDKIDWDFR